MLRHYFITALRNLVRNRFFSLITVAGLATGITSVFFIAQYLKQELSYDRFHDGAENIYRIAWINTNAQTRTPHPMAQAMVQDFPEVESGVSLTPLWGPGLTREIFSVRNPERDVRYDESNVLAVDSTFFNVFSFNVIRGDAKTVLKNPGGILLSESTAIKYFGTIDVIGKQLEVNRENNLVQILGVFKDVPSNSHFHFDILVPLLRIKLEDPGNPFYTWEDFGFYNYIRLKPGTDAKQLQSKLLTWSKKYVHFRDEDIKWLVENKYGFELQPITSIHLESHLRWELESNGNIAYVYLMAAAALLILIVGAINFVNLNMAQASERMKEIGVRKSLGAFRRQLTTQFLGESVLVTVMALLLSILFVEISTPIIQAITGKHFAVEQGIFVLLLVVLGIIISIVAGIYPSLILSSARPALILKDRLASKGMGARKMFIVFQFVASMALISASVIITQQVSYLQNKELGFKPEEVLVLPVKDRAITRRMDALRAELLKIKGVTGISAASNIPGKSYNQNSIFAVQNPQERIDVSEAMIDADFLNVMQMSLAEGRNFLRNNPADSNAFVINETAVNQLGLNNPIGKEIVWERDGGPPIKGPVVGVVKDFHYQSLHEPMRPLLMRLDTRYNYALIKVNTTNFKATIKEIESTWRKFDDRFRFEFSFLDSQLTQQYKEEQSIAQVLNIFSFLGVGIASMGLLGIAALAFRQRTKEVSIRKVLGATLPNLIVLLLKDFTQLVLAAVVLAVPLVWWLMNSWLQNFSYRITINPIVFMITGVALVLVAWATLGFLTMRMARINPAETLKSE